MTSKLIGFKAAILSSVFMLMFCSSGAFAQSFSGEAFKGMGDNDEPIQIEADRLEVSDNDSIAILTGNVSVVQGTTILKAKKITVHYLRGGDKDKTNSGINKIIATGKVAVRSEDNRATANKAVVDMVTEFVTLSGDVMISQGENIMRGCTVTVNLKTNISNVSPCKSVSKTGKGRVQILLNPKSKKNN